jgi:hypothetical protein
MRVAPAASHGCALLERLYEQDGVRPVHRMRSMIRDSPGAALSRTEGLEHQPWHVIFVEMVVPPIIVRTRRRCPVGAYRSAVNASELRILLPAPEATSHHLERHLLPQALAAAQHSDPASASMDMPFQEAPKKPERRIAWARAGCWPQGGCRGAAAGAQYRIAARMTAAAKARWL